MTSTFHFKLPKTLPGIAILLVVCGMLDSCDRSSSPEGRMSIRIETLQKELMDSLHKQNTAVLDSLGKLREEISNLKKSR